MGRLENICLCGAELHARLAHLSEYLHRIVDPPRVCDGVWLLPI
jgi:hypothetical protein